MSELRKRTIYAVVYGNYDPPEVRALYADELDATEHMERLNAGPDSTSMWEVTPMTLHERSGLSVDEGGVAPVEPQEPR